MHFDRNKNVKRGGKTRLATKMKIQRTDCPKHDETIVNTSLMQGLSNFL